MKNIILTLIVAGIPLFSFSQCESDNYLLNFELLCSMQYLINDTINTPDNVWRVGEPQKNIFSSANSAPNAIVTDLHNPYPSNDTSSFILTYVMKGLGPHEYMGTGGYFMSNTDSLSDFGKLEVSFDHGTSWTNLMDPSVIQNNYILWQGNGGYDVAPSFTGNSDGWQWFDVNLEFLYQVNNQEPGDTSLYRFTFVSDGNQTNKDGLMFDDLYVYNGTLLGVPQPGSKFFSNVFPVPSTDYIRIYFFDGNNSTSLFQILDASGKEVINTEVVSGGKVSIKNLSSGIYFYQMLNPSTNYHSAGKFIKE